MIIDLWRGGRLPEQCELAIVGTGPAGSTLAAELARFDHDVVLLESGDIHRRAEVDALNEVENVGRLRAADQWSVRNRILGGSSHTWGGRCGPFDEIDFETRPWVPMSGWPFAAADMAPYLHRAAPHLGLAAGDGVHDARFWNVAGRRAPRGEPDATSLNTFVWQFSRDPDESYPFEYLRFGRAMRRGGPGNVRLVLGATVVEVETDDLGRNVTGVTVCSPDGGRHLLRARVVVLAAGGLENPRILLSSTSSDARGLGNANDLVGRYLMDHPRGPIGEFGVEQVDQLQDRFGRFNVRGSLFRAGFRLGPEIQRREGLLNAAAWMGEVLSPDDPWDAARRLAGLRPRLPDDPRLLLANAGLLARGVKNYLVDRNGFPRRFAALPLLAMCEQRPDPESRLTLLADRDRLGVRKLRVDWRVHDDEGATLRRLARILADELPRLGLPAPTLAPWVLDDADMPESFVDVAHPTGTTRMAERAADGVVDQNGQVHGVSGLFVAGSSTFPTAGHCNPTLMIVALAVRLADHLRIASTREQITGLPRRVASTSKRTVLLTGASGRIGRHVLQDLLLRGHRVRATTTRVFSDLPDHLASTVEWRQIDLAEATTSDLDDLLDGCDAVIHLAAEIGKKTVMSRVNVEATRALAEAAERAGVTSFCYSSSVSVYGSGRGRIMSEGAPTLTIDQDVAREYLALDYVRTYGRTKLGGEAALHDVARRTSYVIFRPTVVVDVPDLLAIERWPRSKRWLAAHREAHHVYVRDVSAALLWGMERAARNDRQAGAVETFNVSDETSAASRHIDFLRRAHAVTGNPRFRVLPVPGIVDWLHDLVRFRRLSVRNPLWRMRFPGDALRAAGFEQPYGMAYAHGLALARLSGRDVESADVSTSPPEAIGAGR